MRQSRRPYVNNVVPAGRRFRFLVGGGDLPKPRWYSFDTKEEAERKRAALIARFDKAAQEAQALTWRQALDTYLHARAEQVSPQSLDTNKGRLLRFLGQTDLNRSPLLTEEGAQGLYDALRPRVSVQEHRHCLSRAKAFGAWMVKQKLWQDNPIATVEPVGKPNKGKPQLTRDESRRLLQWCLIQEQDDGAAATVTLLLLGLRASELCGLTARDLDDAGRLLHVRGTKTEAARRDLVVPHPSPDHPEIPDLRQVLQERVRRALRKQYGAVVELSPPIFGRDRWWVHREVTRCCEQAGVPVVPPHGLRGTWASLARAAGAAPVVVAQSIGHSSTSVQDRHYVDRSAAHQGHQEAVLGALKGSR